MQTAIGVDLGGSHVAAGVVTEDGKIRSQHDLDLTDLQFDKVVDAIVSVVQLALEDAGKKIAGIGLGSPGNVEPKTGAIRYSPNFGWTDAPLGATLTKRLGQPVFVANDARCATLGEYTFGAGKGTEDFALLTLGTGIGGGFVAGGRMVIGHRYAAGEVGHHQIRPETGFICSCGKRGCFEAQASGTGLIRHAFAVAPSFPRSAMLDVPREKLSSKKIRKAAQAGNGHALAAWNNYCDDLATGLTNIIEFVNPKLIALGGGVASAGDFMLEAVTPRVDRLTTMVPRGTTKIVIARLGNDAGQVGAATMAFRGGLKTEK